MSCASSKVRGAARGGSGEPGLYVARGARGVEVGVAALCAGTGELGCIGVEGGDATKAGGAVGASVCGAQATSTIKPSINERKSRIGNFHCPRITSARA